MYNMKKRSAGKRGWLTMEHAKFLMALEIEGKGRWKAISSHIDTKTSKQVQSHAQKYFLRQKQDPATKKKTSIHDFTYTKLEEQFSGEYLRRLKFADPQTYHLFYRYKMSRHQKNPLLYDPPFDGFEGYTPGMGKGFKGMFFGNNYMANMNMMNMNMGNMPYQNQYYGQGMNTQPQMNPQMNQQVNREYQQKLERVPVLDPMGRPLLNRPQMMPYNPQFRRYDTPFQSNYGQGTNFQGGQPSQFNQQPSSPQREKLRKQANHQHYIQYTPDGDFQPVDDEEAEANDVEMVERIVLNPIRSQNFNNF